MLLNEFMLQIKEIPAGGELMNHVQKLDILPGFALEGIPNRDSVKYADLYGIAAEAQTIFRGSLRYHGEKINITRGLCGITVVNPYHVRFIYLAYNQMHSFTISQSVRLSVHLIPVLICQST